MRDFSTLTIKQKIVTYLIVVPFLPYALLSLILRTVLNWISDLLSLFIEILNLITSKILSLDKIISQTVDSLLKSYR